MATPRGTLLWLGVVHVYQTGSTLKLESHAAQMLPQDCGESAAHGFHVHHFFAVTVHDWAARVITTTEKVSSELESLSPLPTILGLLCTYHQYLTPPIQSQ